MKLKLEDFKKAGWEVIKRDNYAYKLMHSPMGGFLYIIEYIDNKVSIRIRAGLIKEMILDIDDKATVEEIEQTAKVLYNTAEHSTI